MTVAPANYAPDRGSRYSAAHRRDRRSRTDPVLLSLARTSRPDRRGVCLCAEGGDPANDNVSPVVIGANDWAAAWAVDRRGNPLFAVVPGGEQQREMAYRFGVNLVMYALTGSYKADQVHLPAILERLKR